MNNTCRTTLHFDYGGYYSRIENSGEYEWIAKENGQTYGLLFKTSIDEMTYCGLIDRIQRKIMVDDCTMQLRLSYISSSMQSRRPTFIWDDDDVQIFLILCDKEVCKSVLHVELIKDTSKDQWSEPSSRVMSNEELISSGRDKYRVSDGGGMINIYEGVVQLEKEHEREEEQEDEHHAEKEDEPIENVDIGDCENKLDNDIDISTNVDNVEISPAIRECSIVEPWDDGLNFEVGQEFSCRRTVKELIERAANVNCYGVVVHKSEPKLYVVKCREAKEGCKWHLRVAKLKNSENFSVRTYTKFHTCSRASSSTSSSRRKGGTPGLVASVLKEDYAGQFKTPAPKGLIGIVQSRVGVKVSYSTAYRGKKQAVYDVRGSPEECYKMVYSYLYMLEKMNPGTRTSVQLNEEKRFQYLFVGLGASIEGFQGMRKVIIVDATFLKTVYGGTLIFAAAQDPNRHHYPIAFAVVDGEKDASWTWFFNELKTVIPDSDELVFVSDRNASLIKAIQNVYPKSEHGYCIYHLSMNVRTKVSNVNKEAVAAKFREVAQIYEVAEFEKEYADFLRRYPSTATYLGTTCEIKKWAKCYFPGARYNIDTSNVVESMNSVFKDARKYSLLPLMDVILGKFGEWFNKHKKTSVGGTGSQKLVPLIEKTLHVTCSEAKFLNVTELNSFLLEYIVIGRDGRSFAVDLLSRTCSCKRFDIDKYPCVHAAAANIFNNDKEDRTREFKMHDLCSKYYWREQWALAYCKTIHPVPPRSSWDVPDEIQALTVLPPYYEKKKGRKKEKRFPSVGERRPKMKKKSGDTYSQSGTESASQSGTQGQTGSQNWDRWFQSGSSQGESSSQGWGRWFV